MVKCSPTCRRKEVGRETGREGAKMTEQVILEATPLNAIDRCDRCGAQAYVRATLLSGGELLFCGHHAKEYAEKLKPVAKSIHDETERLSTSI